MERKIKQEVSLKEIFIDEDLYPRSSVNWHTSYDYAQSMVSGAKFPPIVLAIFANKKYLVDGRHRIDARKQLKKETIQAEIYVGWDKKKIFEEAVRMNIAHGRVLSPFEKRRIALKLREEGYDSKNISELIQVPQDKLENFVAQRLTNALTGETIVKSEIKHLAGQNFEGEIESLQKPMKSKSQVMLLTHTVYLLEKGLIDKENKVIAKLLKRLKELL